jgi:hypothetical protein
MDPQMSNLWKMELLNFCIAFNGSVASVNWVWYILSLVSNSCLIKFDLLKNADLLYNHQLPP